MVHEQDPHAKNQTWLTRAAKCSPTYLHHDKSVSQNHVAPPEKIAIGNITVNR